ncbi:MAG: hypothetical protein ACKN93_03110, partial [Candidatus Limnocylindrus sp.]
MQIGAHQISPRIIASISISAAALALSTVMLLGATEEPPIDPVPLVPQLSSPAVDVGQIRVEISGGVSQPGVISLPEGSRLIDGISAA